MNGNEWGIDDAVTFWMSMFVRQCVYAVGLFDIIYPKFYRRVVGCVALRLTLDKSSRLKSRLRSFAIIFTYFFIRKENIWNRGFSHVMYVLYMKTFIAKYDNDDGNHEGEMLESHCHSYKNVWKKQVFSYKIHVLHFSDMSCFYFVNL